MILVDVERPILRFFKFTCSNTLEPTVLKIIVELLLIFSSIKNDMLDFTFFIYQLCLDLLSLGHLVEMKFETILV